MRHNKNRTKLGRTAEHREALMRNLLTSLIQEKKIKTTLPKAKILKAYADKFLARIRTADLAAKKKAFSILTEKSAGKELFDNVVPNLPDKKSGFIKLYHAGIRKGDAADMAIVQLVLVETYKEKKAPKVKKEKLPEAKKSEEKKAKKSEAATVTE
ncbi:MAG: 50S ribosomal protein L17 [bacterium]|nr:50S ribosomal protein L17 [bacterium]